MDRLGQFAFFHQYPLQGHSAILDALLYHDVCGTSCQMDHHSGKTAFRFLQILDSDLTYLEPSLDSHFSCCLHRRLYPRQQGLDRLAQLWLLHSRPEDVFASVRTNLQVL